MNHPFEFEPGLEPERYELDAGPAYRFDFDRRDFFKSVSAGIVVLCLVKKTLAQESGLAGRRGGRGGGASQDLGAWLHIDENGQVTAFTGKVEVGQNIRTSLTQAVAEELHTPMASIRLVMGDTQLTPYDGGTVGSQSTPNMGRQLRRVAAAARELLIDLAAETWKVDRASLAAIDGKVVRKETNEWILFGKLSKGQKLTKTIADDTALAPAKDWKVAGQSAPKVNGRSFVTGQHKYTSDVKVLGMWHGKVLRPPALGASLVSIDTKEAGAMPDVILVRDGDFVGVIAPSEFIAVRALKAIKAEWKNTPQISGKELFAQLKSQSGGGGGGGRGGGRGGGGPSRTGSMQEGLNAAEIRQEQTYTIAYIAHAPLEPRAAVAQWEGGKLTVWTGTQRPFGVQSELATAFRMSNDNIRVIVPDTGSGYGGKHTGEAAVEAARLAKGAGKAVKLIWTREEEFTWAYFRPAGVIEVKSGVRKDGTLTAWEFHNYNSGASAIATQYEVPNKLIEFHATRSPLRQGSYRALASTANVFARETHLDELAHATGIDPLEFRLKNLKDARFRTVFEAAAEKFGWRKLKPGPNRGCGVAGGFEKGAYVATCAEVEVNRGTGQVKVIRAVSAFECGAVVNPDQLKNQVEGAMVMGLGGALFEAIQFEGGKVLNGRFSDYRVPRFSDTPVIEVVLVDRKDSSPIGAGETPIIGIAPAIGNAIFAATGMRLRSLPLVPDGFKA